MNMRESRFDFFTKKFEENLKQVAGFEKAFEKTNEEIGFDVYSSYRSYNTSASNRRKKGRR